MSFQKTLDLLNGNKKVEDKPVWNFLTDPPQERSTSPNTETSVGGVKLPTFIANVMLGKVKKP